MPVLLIRCSRCNNENPLYTEIQTDSANSIVCNNCQFIIFNYRIINGYIYILSNISMPGILKIGMTKRPIEERIKELGAHTGVPSVFVLEACFESDNPDKHERIIHAKLKDQRLEGKEFFRININDASDLVSNVCGGKLASGAYFNNLKTRGTAWMYESDPLKRYELWINKK